MSRGQRIALSVAILAIGGLLAYVIGSEPPVGQLTGRVVAQETGNPLTATIYLTSIPVAGQPESYLHMESAQDGTFRFRDLPVGDYKLEIKSKVHSLPETVIHISEAKTETIEAELTSSAPMLDLYIHQHVFTPDEKPQITCQGFLDGDTLAIRLYKVDADAFLVSSSGDLQRLLGIRSYYSESGAQTNADLDQNQSLKLTESLYSTISSRDLEGVFTQRVDLPILGPGIYVASVKAGGIQKLGWIMVTSLGMVTKTAGLRTVAYTVDLKSGNPVSADVGVYVDSSVVASGTTSERGLLELTLPQQEGRSSEEMVVARKGESIAFVSSWFSSTSESSPVFYAYTDRPVYRPGQTVYFKGIVRQPTDGGYSVPGPMPITIEVRDPQDTLIYRTKTSTDRFGSYHGSFDLNSETSTGYYTISASVQGRERGEGTTFQVAAYRKPEFNVKVTFPKKRYVRGEVVKAKVSAQYYFGAPVASANVSYFVRRSSYWPFYDEEDYGWESEYEDYGGYGEYVTQGQARTDANGEATVEFVADWPQPEGEYDWDTDQEFGVEASVTDQSNRQANGEATVLVTRGDFALELTPVRYVVAPGESVGVKIEAMDYDKKPVGRQKLTIVAGRQIWTNENESRFEKLSEGEVVTDSAGHANWEFKPTKSGDIRVTVTGRDARGNTITSTAYVWVYSEAAGWDEGIRFADLEIVTDKKMYSPGDIAKVLINTNDPGATALVTVEGDRVYEKQVVPLKTQATAVEFAVKPEYAPNFYISVCYVKDKEFTSREANVRVLVKARELNITVKPGQPKYKPDETATYKIKATDSKGRPAQAQLSIGVVDEAIYAISEDRTEPILDAFYSRKPNGVETTFSFPRIYLSDPDKARAAEAKKELKDIRVRKRFLDTAYWNPTVLTNANGEATVSFRLPDNLTTWRATVRGVTMNTTVGEAKSTMITAQDFLVRLEIPRFLVQTDKADISAVIHNYTGKDQSVKVLLESPGLKIENGAVRNALVRNGGTARCDYTISAPNAGSFPITVRAGNKSVGDAMQLDIPVYPHGLERQTMTSGAIAGTGTATANIEVRSDAVPGASKLKIRLAPSLAAAMLGSLDYLAQYPYGCTEQTTSSFIPDVILSRSLKSMGISDPRLEKQLPDMVTKGLFRLYRFQLNDGGWSWYVYGEADPWMTAYVLYGLIQARNAGFPVNESIITKGLGKLGELASKPNLRPDTRAYMYYVLALAGNMTVEKLDYLARQGLNSQSVALLTLSYAQLGATDRANAMLRDLHDRASVQPGSIHWTVGNRLDGDDIQATAFGLQATLRMNPNDPRAIQIVRWLMEQRRWDYWYSTRDTAMVLYAMSEFIAHTKELTPDFTAVVTVNGSPMAARRFAKASVFEPEFEVVVPTRDLRKGRNSLVVQKTGAGNLYYSTELTQYLAKDLKPITLTGAGITITRRYYRLPNRYAGSSSERDLGRPISGCRAGDVILVRLVANCSRTVEHAMIEDWIPAGCEIIDRGQVDPWDWYNWWGGQDVRDEKISFYADTMSPGRHVIDYQMRAGFAGSFHALPAQVFAMYQPEIRTWTPESEFKIR